MATVTGFTAERMLEIEDNAVVSGAIVGDNLILEKHNGELIDTGNARGPIGATGPSGGVSQGTLDAAILADSDDKGKGIIAQATVATDQVLTGFSQDTWHDVTGASITFTAVVGRAYQFEAQVAVSSEDVSTLFDAQILRVGGGVVGAQTVFCHVINRACAINLSRTIVAPAGWGASLTFKLQVRDNTDNTTRVKGTTWNTILTVIDVGVI